MDVRGFIEQFDSTGCARAAARVSKASLLSIGDMAAINGVSVRSLRLYQDKGILIPSHVNEETGYRYYTIAQCLSLDMISELHEIGFTLDEIREIIEEHDPIKLEDRVEARAEAIEKERKRLDAAAAVASDILDNCRVMRKNRIVNQILLENMPARKALVFETPAASFDDPGYDANVHWMLATRLVKQDFEKHGYPKALFRRICCSILHDDLVKRQYIERRAVVFLDETAAGALPDDACVTEFPAGVYLTLYTPHSVDEDDPRYEAELLDRMLDYADKKKLVPVTDYVGRPIGQTPALGFEGVDAFTQMSFGVALG